LPSGCRVPTNRFEEKKAEGWWLQAELRAGKSHLLASTSILAIGGDAAWEHIKKRVDEEKKILQSAHLRLGSGSQWIPFAL
jgi:hypothetical protein